MKKVIVAGMDSEVNPFTRMIVNCGMKYVHIAEDSPKDIPSADAAIVCLNNVSHGLQEKIKSEFNGSGRRIFYAKQGASSIKDEFEQHFFGKYKDKLEELPESIKCEYVLSKHYEIGSILDTKQFMQILTLYVEDGVKMHNVYNFLNRMTKNEIIQPLAGRGRHRYLGISEEQYTKLTVLHQLELEPTCVQTKLPKVEAKVIAVPTKIKEIQQQNVEKNEDALSLLGDFENRLVSIETNIGTNSKVIGDIERRMMTKLDETYVKIKKQINQTTRLHYSLYQLMPRLKSMSADQVKMVNTLVETMFAFTKEVHNDSTDGSSGEQGKS